MRSALHILVILITCTLPAFSQSESDLPAKKEEFKLSEVVPADSLPLSELMARAVNWVKAESIKYGKTNGAATTSRAEITVTFHVKPKELRPQCDFTGKITFRVIIECKHGKYRYTITHLKHTSVSGTADGGDYDNEIPQCGTITMTVLTWKKLKGDMLAKAASVAEDVKAAMKMASDKAGKDEW